MRRWLLAGVVALAVVGLVVVLALANLNRWLAANRDWLTAQAAAEIGRPIHVDDVSVSLLGGVGIEAAGVRVGDDPRYAPDDFLRVSEVQLVVRVLPALFGRIEVRRVVLREPVVTVIRDQHGWNLDSLRPRAPRERAPSTEPPSERHSDPSLLLVSLLNVRDGTVTYVDRRMATPTPLVLRQVEVTASDLSTMRPMTVDASAAVLDAPQRNAVLRGSVGPLGEPLVVATVPVDLTATVDGIDAAALRRIAPELQASIPSDVLVEGPLAFRARARGTVAALDVEGSCDATAATVRWGVLFAKPGGVPLDVVVAGTRAEERVAVTSGRLRLAAFEAALEGSVQPGTPPVADLRVTAKRTPLASLTALVPPAAAAQVDGTMEARLAVKGPLVIDHLPAIDGTVTLADVHAQIPERPETLRDLSTTLTFAGDRVTMPPTRFRVGDASVEAGGVFTVAERLLVIERCTAEVYGGTVEATGRIDVANPEEPRMSAAGTVRGITLAPLLATYVPETGGRFDGRLDADFTGTAVGDRTRQLRRSLNGSGRVEVRDGVLRGVNLVEDVLGGLAGIGGLGHLVPQRLREKRRDLFGTADTRFRELRASGKVAGERLRTEDLVITTDAYTVQGRGSMGFDGDVDFHGTFSAGQGLTADIVSSVKETRYILGDDGRLGIPFHVKGTMSKLRASPDADFVSEAVGRVLVEKGLGSLLGDSKKKDGKPGKEKPADKLRRGLRELFGE